MKSTRGLLNRLVEDAYNFTVPLEKVTDRKYVMRLDQGPTASFKDFAARMMARLMSAVRDKGQTLHVLVATSGDTGSAVGDAFHGVAGIDVTILYPQGEVSGRQKKQLDSIGDNVQAISVDGKFDDCQNLVKEAFADPDAGGPESDLGQFDQLRPDHAPDDLLRLRLCPTGRTGREDCLFRPVGQFRRRPGVRICPADGAAGGEARHARQRKRGIPALSEDRGLSENIPVPRLSVQRHERGPPEQPGPILRSVRRHGGPERLSSMSIPTGRR